MNVRLLVIGIDLFHHIDGQLIFVRNLIRKVRKADGSRNAAMVRESAQKQI